MTIESWKTSGLGSLVILGAISKMILDGEADPIKILLALVGTGLLASKDHDK